MKEFVISWPRPEEDLYSYSKSLSEKETTEYATDREMFSVFKFYKNLEDAV